MRNVTAKGMVRAGVFAAGALMICAVPSLGQRSRDPGDRDQRSDSRPANRTEPANVSRPTTREDRPVSRESAPSEVRSTPRFNLSQPESPSGRPVYSAPRVDVPQRSAPVSSAPSWRNSDRGSSQDNGNTRSTLPGRSPDNGSVSRGGNISRTPSPSLGDTRSSQPSGRTAPTWRGTPRSDSGSSSSPQTPSYRDGGTTQRNPSDTGRTMGPRQGTLQSGSDSTRIGWRAPSRTGSISGNTPGIGSPAGRPGGNASIGSRPIDNNKNTPRYGSAPPSPKVRYVPTGRGYRPPRIDHDRWRDRDYGRRHFHTIDLGWYDPWYRYNWGIYVGVNFYYPYYYCGPYVSGYYYSPFWCYGGWAPVYIYPERVIYIEKRVYLHDVVDDDYDLYSSGQTSMRDTMEDIRTAWLDGDGGRLLDHINQAIPVRIYQKGHYKYSLEPDDFRDVTKDALNRIPTSDFEWTNVDRVASDEVHLEARHTFRDPDGDRHVIRLTYTLEKAQGSWWITETGTEAWNSDTTDL